MENLTKRLSMDHVQKSDVEMREQIEEREAAIEKLAEDADAPPEKKRSPRDERTYSFPFKYTTARGVTYEATFTNHILDIGTKQRVSIMESQLNGGQPYDSIEPLTQTINRGIAWMAFSLRERTNQKPAKWADNLRALDDENIVLALFEEVSAHEGQFHGRDAGSPES